MRKSYKFKKRIKREKPFYFNYKIRSPRVSVVDETNSHLGEMNTIDAVKLAEERGFDLVEVAPNATPPVAKIMDYGSFKYQREKEFKKQQKQSKTLDVKSIRISLKIGEHDMDTRLKQAEKFLEKGHKIKIELILKGREMRYIDLGKEKIKEFKAKIACPVQIEQDTTKQGNKLFIILIPENN